MLGVSEGTRGYIKHYMKSEISTISVVPIENQYYLNAAPTRISTIPGRIRSCAALHLALVTKLPRKSVVSLHYDFARNGPLRSSQVQDGGVT